MKMKIFKTLFLCLLLSVMSSCSNYNVTNNEQSLLYKNIDKYKKMNSTGLILADNKNNIRIEFVLNDNSIYDFNEILMDIGIEYKDFNNKIQNILPTEGILGSINWEFDLFDNNTKKYHFHLRRHVIAMGEQIFVNISDAYFNDENALALKGANDNR